MSCSGSRGLACAADEEAMVAKKENSEDEEEDVVARRKLGLRLGDRRQLGFVAGGEGETAWEGNRIMPPVCQEAQAGAASTVRGSDETGSKVAPGPMGHKQHAVRQRQQGAGDGRGGEDEASGMGRTASEGREGIQRGGASAVSLSESVVLSRLHKRPLRIVHPIFTLLYQ